jgi:tRNA-2-methylthio-N6-dimethylallyladenosine synthase
MDQQVPDPVKRERLKRLVDLQTGITRDRYGSMTGKTIEVLVTGRMDKRDFAWMGQDHGCKRVLIHTGEDCMGKLMRVKIVRSTGMTLIGERVAAYA